MLQEAVTALAPLTGTAAACQALGVPRARYYRARRPRSPAVPRSRPVPARALAATERQTVLAVLHSERFCDAAPAEVYATLLDEGTYLCSERTMYRILAAEGETRARRAQRVHPVYHKPELLAEGPNQLWSWDITKLLGPAKWTYYYLYVILDVFSRSVVGWMVAHRESAELAQRFIEETAAKQQIPPGQLTLHADRGASMTSKPVAFLLADLGITKTHSRPHVSNDNPYSESQFKTLKYRPDFPSRFASMEEARSFCCAFFPWYNTEHHHSGIGFLTPEAVHLGQAPVLHQARRETLAVAYALHPERFVRQEPVPPPLPTAAWINKPSPSEEVAH
jgi:putative transposase